MKYCSRIDLSREEMKLGIEIVLMSLGIGCNGMNSV